MQILIIFRTPFLKVPRPFFGRNWIQNNLFCIGWGEKVGRSVNNLRQATFFMLFSAFQCIFATFYVFFNGSGKELFLKAGRSRPVALKKSSFPRNNAAGSRHGFVAKTQNRARKKKYQRVRTPRKATVRPTRVPHSLFWNKIAK